MKRVMGIAMALAALLVAGRVRAQEAFPPPPAPEPADSTFRQYLDTLRDSTDVYFGEVVAPVDTSGLDSSLAAALAKPPGARAFSRRDLHMDLGPYFTFNRVDGPTYGLTAETGRRRGLGRIGGRAAYAVGADTWFGEGRFRRAIQRNETEWEFSAGAGRWTASMDRERPRLGLAALRALTFGSDSRRYLRRDGFETELSAEHHVWRGRVGYRDMHESPVEPTARWSILNSSLSVSDNLAAIRGHTHELGYLLGALTPGLPLTIEGEYFTSSGKIGSDFEYRRSRISMGGDFEFARTIVFIPQVLYGRLSGDPVTQAMFFIGGQHTMRSIEGDSRAGTGIALAKLDVIELPDLLEVLRIPHPALLPIQVSVFAATGAVWGPDPYGGPVRPGTDWPNREDFIHEAGATIIYRPGIPDPVSFIQLSWAWPIGPGVDGPKFTASYTRGLDLVHPFGLSEGP